MNRVDGAYFKDCDVILDGNHYTGCTFSNVDMYWNATDEILIDAGNRFSNVRIHLGVLPQNTIKFLQQLYGIGLTGPVDLVINQIRGHGTSAPN